MDNAAIPEQTPVPDLDIQEPGIRQKLPLILSLGTGALILVLIGTYLFMRSRTQPADSSNVSIKSSPSPSATISTTPNPTPIPTSLPFSDPNIPPEWSLRHSEACGVSYFLPPRKDPYITNFFKNNPDTADMDGSLSQKKYWDSSEFNSDNFSSPFKTSLQIFLATPIPQVGLGMSILCADNSSNLTTESLFQLFQNDHNEKIEVIKRSEKTLWGHRAYGISYVGNEYYDSQKELYLLAIPKHVYLIDKIDIKGNFEESDININANTLIFNKLKLE